MRKKLNFWSNPWAQTVGAILLCASLFLVVWLVPLGQVNFLPPSAERIKVEIAARDVLVKAIGGILFFVTAFVSIQNLRVAEDKQIAERFSKAIEMLAHEESVHVRLGGIYALERIARDSQKDRYPVMQVLAAFIKVKAAAILKEKTDVKEQELCQYKEFSSNKDFHEQEQEERYGDVDYTDDSYEFFLGTSNRMYIPNYLVDVQAAISAIGKRNRKDSDSYELDLSQTEIEGITFKGNYENVSFYKTHLKGCSFGSPMGVDGEYTSFIGTNFREALFEKVEFRNSCFKEAHLDSSVFIMSSLSMTDFSHAFLPEAKFSGGTKIQSCHFDKANLAKISIGDEVKVSRVPGEKRSHAYFEDKTEIKKTSFKDAVFTEAALNNVLFEGVKWTPKTKQLERAVKL